MDKEYTDLGNAADYLAWLEHARQDREEAERQMAKCVRGARAQGASWAQIGRQIGVSKQAAQKKYGMDTAAAAPVPTHAPNGEPIYLPSIGDTPAAREALAEKAKGIHGSRTVAIFAAFAADRARLKASDDYGTTPVDMEPPANRWEGAADSLGRPVYWLERPASDVAQPGTGVGDHNCPRCQSTNHKGGAWRTVAAFKDCEPTRFDPQNIVDWFYRGLGVRKSK